MSEVALTLDPPSEAGTIGVAVPNSRRTTIIAAVACAWFRVMFVLATRPFETPDTQSYRSGQNLRPPIGATLLSWLGDTPYILVSALVSTFGFVALAWAIWNPDRRRRSFVVIGLIGAVSLLPMVAVYEHWLVPDSLLTGLALIALALASRRVDVRWYPWALVALCVVVTCTKEVGFGIVLLVAMVLLVRGSYRTAIAAVFVCAILFALVVLPASNREGRVLWFQPTDTELTMERFRFVIAGMMWPDLSPELSEVRVRAAECGMTNEQLIAETFRLTDDTVAFRDCPELWEVVDEISQRDILEAHARNPVHVRASIERGFAPDMSAMAAWGDYLGDHPWLMRFDQLAAAMVALVPLAAMAVGLIRRRGRMLALVAMAGLSMAFVAALVDPSSQDRHTFVFRIAACAIALLSLSESATNVIDVEGAEAITAVDEASRPEVILQTAR